jgi:dTDP-4-dehydrorhamnose reductase
MSGVGPILLIGARGQVGSALIAHYNARATASARALIALSHDELDLEDASAIRKTIRRHAPAAIVNAAAYTAVDKAESDRARCFAVNADAPVVIAEQAARAGVLLIHYSTDYVFDGRNAVPYLETDTVAPLNVYGESKAAAERGIAALGGNYVILRTSWVFSSTGTNFVRTILRLAAEREGLRVVDDQVGSPTSAQFIAEVTGEILRRELDPSNKDRLDRGLYHLSSSGTTSWYGFARQILEDWPNRSSLAAKTIVPIASSELNQPARRPAVSVLDTGKLRAALNLSIPTWKEQLDGVLGEIVAVTG